MRYVKVIEISISNVVVQKVSVVFTDGQTVLNRVSLNYSTEQKGKEAMRIAHRIIGTTQRGLLPGFMPVDTRAEEAISPCLSPTSVD